MDYRLTANTQFSHHDKDGRDRNYISYFLNDILIIKQKIPFDTNWESGFDRRVHIYDAYILNGKMYQKRQFSYGCGDSRNDKTEVRNVSFPLSKRVLSQFNIPKDFRIDCEVE